MKKYILILLILCSINLFGQTATDWKNKGLDNYSRGNYKEAILDFNKAIELDPTNYIYYYHRATQKKFLEDFRGAILDYDKAIELDPYAPHLYSDRGLAKYYLKDFRGAILDYDKAIELFQINKEYYYRRGDANYQLGYLNAACLDWSKAGELGYGDAYDLIKKHCNN